MSARGSSYIKQYSNINVIVYNAVTNAEPFVKGHLVHVMNADSVPCDCQPSNQANQLRL